MLDIRYSSGHFGSTCTFECLVSNNGSTLKHLSSIEEYTLTTLELTIVITRLLS